MDVVCVGGGPAGLYFAICASKLPGDHRIRVIERDPPGATFGWGITYSDRVLDMLFEHDPESAREVRARSVTWEEQEWRLHGEAVYAPQIRSSLERAALLDVLARRAVELGVEVQFGRAVDDPAELSDADLVVASDGVGSVVRRQFAEHFGTTTVLGRDRFIWLGTDHVFPASPSPSSGHPPGGSGCTPTRRAPRRALVSSSARRRRGRGCGWTSWTVTRGSGCWRASSPRRSAAGGCSVRPARNRRAGSASST